MSKKNNVALFILLLGVFMVVVGSIFLILGHAETSLVVSIISIGIIVYGILMIRKENKSSS